MNQKDRKCAQMLETDKLAALVSLKLVSIITSKINSGGFMILQNSVFNGIP